MAILGTIHVECIRSELLNTVESFSDLLVCNRRYCVEPIIDKSEDSLFRTSASLRLALDDVSHDVLSILHMNLKELNSFSLGLHLLNHLHRDNLLQVTGPVVVGLFADTCKVALRLCRRLLQLRLVL